MTLPLVTVDEVRAAGLTEQMADDDTVDPAIQIASEYVERVCGIPFLPATFDEDNRLVVDGSGHDTLWLQVPILTLTAAGTIDSAGDVVAFTLADVAVYNRRPPAPDDRRNPKLVLRTGAEWPKGVLNIYLHGTFGFCEPGVDEDDNPVELTPKLVKRAVLLLVINDFVPELADSDAQDERLRRWIKTETTEGHSYTLSDLAHSAGPSGIAEVDRLLRMYTRALHVRA